MNKKILSLVLLGFLFLPLAISAQLHNAGGGGPAIDVTSLVDGAERTAGLVFGGVAVVMFVVAGILFLTAQGAPEKLKTAKAAALWGVAGVIVGIVAFSIIMIVGNLIT